MSIEPPQPEPSPTATASAEAKEPKRERGKLRVAALMNAGGELFSEKGYEATTMTEIAQRAGASIGSLYQFFPSKEALAEALFLRYAARAGEKFDEMLKSAPMLNATQLADLIVDMRLEMLSHRDAAIALSESISAIVERRQPMRDLTCARIAAILRAMNPALPNARAIVSAAAILQVMKGVQTLAAMERETGHPFVAEARTMLSVYIARALQT
ncbi:MAG TPA: helix-turn-helix domain-containing protein [Burkholderiaceae bacterium]